MTRAAARLHVTQQAVSSQLRQLERAVGARLLIRTAQGVELSEAGEVVAKRGAEILAGAELMLDEARLVARGGSGRLRVAFKAQSTAHLMPLVRQAIRLHRPDVDVELVSARTLPEEIGLLVDGGVDAAVVWLPLGDDRLTAATILTETRVVALPTDHPLARREVVGIRELADDPVVGPHGVLAPEVTTFWLGEPRPDGRQALRGPEASTPEDCLQHVADHRGVWLAPASAAQYFRFPVLAWRPVPDAAPFRLALAWPRARPNPILPMFVDAFRTLAASALPTGERHAD